MQEAHGYYPVLGIIVSPDRATSEFWDGSSESLIAPPRRYERTSDRVSTSHPQGGTKMGILMGMRNALTTSGRPRALACVWRILSKTHGCVFKSSKGLGWAYRPARYVAVAILARNGNAMRHRQWPVGSGGWPAGRWWSVFGKLLCRREHWNGWGRSAWAETVGATSPKGERLERQRAAKPSKADRGAGPTPSHPTKNETMYSSTGYERPQPGNCCETGELCSPCGYPQRFQGLFLPRPNNAYLVHQLFPWRDVSGDLEVKTGRRRKFGLHEIRKLLTTIVN